MSEHEISVEASPPHLHRHGVGRRVILVLTVLLLTAVATDRMRWAVGSRRSPRTFRTLAVEKLRTHPPLIFVGSSHIYTGIDPAEFHTEVVSIADSGLNYQLAERLLRHHWEDVCRAQRVVIELDSVPICEDTIQLRGGDLREFWQWQLTGKDLPVPIWDRVLADMDRVCGCSRFPPLTENRAPASDAGEIRPGFSGRRQKLNVSMFEEFFRTLDRATDRANVERNLDAVTRIVRSLQSRGVEVLLLRTPHHRDYWSHPVGLRLESETEVALVELRSRFGSDMPTVLDLRNPPGLTDQDFSDWTHLSVRGARAFSRQLNDVLVNEVGESTAGRL